MSEQLTLSISSLITEGLQMRATLNESAVGEYASDMQAGVVFPPVEVVFNEAEAAYYLVNGHHRVAAAKQLDLPSIPVKLHAINAKGETIRSLIDESKRLTKPPEPSLTDAEIGKLPAKQGVEAKARQRTAKVPKSATEPAKSDEGTFLHPQDRGVKTFPSEESSVIPKRLVPYNDLWKTPLRKAAGEPIPEVDIREMAWHPKAFAASEAYQKLAREHLIAVRDAVEAGKPVPPDVLADYPNLKSSHP